MASNQAIFDAVSDVITESGPAGLTLAAVADRVGVSAPALTQRFGSKRELLVAYADASATNVEEHFSRTRANSRDALDALRSTLVAFTSAVTTRSALANNLAFLHLDLTDPELGKHAARQSRLLRRGLARLVRDAQEAGQLSAGDPDELADTLYTTYNGALVTWAIDGRGSLARWLAQRIDRVLEPYVVS